MNVRKAPLWVGKAFRNKTFKKTFVYRFLSIVTEFIGAYLITRNLEVPTFLTLWCIMVHTFLYLLIERRWH